MSEITVNMNPAQLVKYVPSDAWARFAEDVQLQTITPLEFGNGKEIKLESGSTYVAVGLKVKEVLTPEKFFALKAIIEESLMKAVMVCVVDADWLQGIETWFDVEVPEIPEEFLEDGYNYTAILKGNKQLVMVRVPSND